MNRELRNPEGAGSSINGNNSNSAGIHMKTLCKQGRLKEALQMLHLMDYRGITVDASFYASLLQGCANNKTLSEGKLVHAHMVHCGIQLDILLGTELVIMYAKCGRLDDARKFWDEMPERNVGSWRSLIASYARHGFYEEALALFHEMKRSGIEPDQFIFATVLPVCANMVGLECGKQIHEEIIRNGFHCNVFAGSALVDMYCKCGRIEDARNVFDTMPERNVVSWNSMIAGYVKNGQADDALKLFRQMTERNLVSWNTMIAGFVQTGRLNEAMELFEAMPERNVVSWTAMVSGFAQNGQIDNAMKLFQEMPERNMVSWNAMISGLTRNGYCDEALKIFRQMKLTGARPDLDTFASILSSCAKLAALEHGRGVHEEIIRSGFHSDVFVETALVDMYGKCGSLEDARKVFYKMCRRNRVSWNVMILIYAIHGYGKDALRHFEQMQLSGMNPDQATFVGVLFACCHAGLVDDGRRYFELMKQYYHITPTVDHYCCMVDLLGRSGYLDEARNLIDKMPIKPDAAVWVSLLGACRVHTNLKLGEHVAELLFLSNFESSAPYVLLSNLYAAAGRWDDTEQVRKMMKDKKVKKNPGCSWVGINSKVHAFLVEDKD